MIKVSVFWTNDSDQLVDFLKYVSTLNITTTIPADEQSGDGEEIWTSDVDQLKKVANDFGCTVVSPI